MAMTFLFKTTPFFLAATCLWSAQAAEKAASAVEVLETRFISHEKNYYHGWPTLAQRDGRLMAIYSGGREDHVCPFGRIEMITSPDQGKTWSWPRIVMDSVTDDRDGGVLVTRKGTILVTFFTSVAYQKHLAEPERRYRAIFKEETDAFIQRARLAGQRVTPEELKKDVGYWIMRSLDGGVTWSERIETPCYSPHGPTELVDGRLFYAGSDGKKCGAWISKDDGVTWELLSEIDVRPGETHGIEAADGTLVVHIRDKVDLHGESKKQWAVVQVLSKDGGKTWSAPEVITTGYPSHLYRMADGRLLMSYGSRKEPYGIRAKVSSDNAGTWSDELVITSDGTTSDLGYPSTTQLGDGSFLTVWYEVTAAAPKAQLRQAKWLLK